MIEYYVNAEKFYKELDEGYELAIRRVQDNIINLEDIHSQIEKKFAGDIMKYNIVNNK